MQKAFMLLIVITISCSNTQNENLIVPSESVGKFKLGDKLIGKYEKEDFEIIATEEDSIIKEIIVKSPKYKTRDGFGVGSTLKQIEAKKGNATKRVNIKKGSIAISAIKDGLFYDTIWYIDKDKDGLVDGIWLFQTKPSLTQ